MAADICIVVLPIDNPLKQWLDILEFTDNYGYTYWILGSIALNTLLTYTCEKLIVAKLTVICDKKGADEKAEKFRKQMMISKNESMA